MRKISFKSLKNNKLDLVVLVGGKGTRIKELKISGHYAYNLFNVYEEELLNSHLHGSRQDPTTQDPNSWKSGRG